jgi:hypothetical protein
MHAMNPTIVTILTSAVVSSVVASFFNYVAQRAERHTRRKELIFEKAFELAKANRDFLVKFAESTGRTANISDYVVYAEMYHWLLEALYDNGKLPKDWRDKSKEMMDAHLGKN